MSLLSKKIRSQDYAAMLTDAGRRYSLTQGELAAILGMEPGMVSNLKEYLDGRKWSDADMKRLHRLMILHGMTLYTPDQRLVAAIRDLEQNRLVPVDVLAKLAGLDGKESIPF